MIPLPTKFLKEYQFAYRAKRICETALIDVGDDILWAMEHKNITTLAGIVPCSTQLTMRHYRGKLSQTDYVLALFQHYALGHAISVDIHGYADDQVMKRSFLAHMGKKPNTVSHCRVQPRAAELHGFQCRLDSYSEHLGLNSDLLRNTIGIQIGKYFCHSSTICTTSCLLTPNEDTPPIPEYQIRSGETSDLKRARLLYQSRKRGMLENGILLSRFADRYLQKLTEEQLDQYDNLINKPSNDWDIFHWISGKSLPPPEYQSEVMNMLQNFVQNKEKEKLCPDSKIAKSFSCCRAKTSYIIRHAFGETFDEELKVELKGTFMSLG
ncbi:hypothetical protein LSH36_87g06047 [Paralvinella palmiformis]|uniref:Succinate dehydrogenase assembly factor 2, mitochondrial n=1 Tax=Paralvinella palmiformis TaxID=53620 RepID=A0AAD9K1A1_9ANNE|nr:hypothetical protein LSH36_87g06047 [Paralvinella palmiformis]